MIHEWAKKGIPSVYATAASILLRRLTREWRSKYMRYNQDNPQVAADQLLSDARKSQERVSQDIEDTYLKSQVSLLVWDERFRIFLVNHLKSELKTASFEE